MMTFGSFRSLPMIKWSRHTPLRLSKHRGCFRLSKHWEWWWRWWHEECMIYISKVRLGWRENNGEPHLNRAYLSHHLINQTTTVGVLKLLQFLVVLVCEILQDRLEIIKLDLNFLCDLVEFL